MARYGNNSADQSWDRSQILDWSQFLDRRTGPDRTVCSPWLRVINKVSYCLSQWCKGKNFFPLNLVSELIANVSLFMHSICR